MLTLLHKIFGSSNDRLLKKWQSLVVGINAHEDACQKMTDDEFPAQTQKWREELHNGRSLDDLLIPAFASVREVARRVLGQRHFDVQLLGGIALHNGMIAEMKTGEGKTLAATLPVYLNALLGKGVHVVTVNDYLASRDSQWMGSIYHAMGMTTGCIIPSLDPRSRKSSYKSDITYGTNNEFGFDYLRDHMVTDKNDLVQRPLYYAIVDEVDSILIDEARTPLVISGASEQSSQLYGIIDKIIKPLEGQDYEKDEKSRSVTLTEQGTEKVEKALRAQGLMKEGALYDMAHVNLVHHVNQALRAHCLFRRDVDYMVNQGQVVLVDEFTGRMMQGRRFSGGLHQALEAKEQVDVQVENQTLASISFQNYFRIYEKLGGMTGTAKTEEEEFQSIYKVKVAEIPTHRTMIRQDLDDEIYRARKDKLKAITARIQECYERHQPVLVGTTSIEKSEEIAALLKKMNIAHNVLNARYHEREAHIIAQAGKPRAVTIATNMAGRGTDIQLGGNLDMRLQEECANITDLAKKRQKEDVIKKEIEDAKQEAMKAGGLFVIGTERHESRRIDNQLRGRSGRQGDEGASIFYLSLEDDLMRIFGAERMDAMMERFGIPDEHAITHPWVNKAILKAQTRVEAHNFDIRKNLLRFDDVMNEQRQVIYEQRREILEEDNVSDITDAMREDAILETIDQFAPDEDLPEQWDIASFHAVLLRLLGLAVPLEEWVKEDVMDSTIVRERLLKAGTDILDAKKTQFGIEEVRIAEKRLLLYFLDLGWKDHLQTLDHLRQGINLRAYAQRDPLNEYRREAFLLFETMLDRLKRHVTSALCHLVIEKGARQGMPPSPLAARQGTVQQGAPLPKNSRRPTMPQRKMKKKKKRKR